MLAVIKLRPHPCKGQFKDRGVENLNLMTMENIKKIEMKREREWRLGFFKWFGYVSLRPHDVANELHLYYILCMI